MPARVNLIGQTYGRLTVLTQWYERGLAWCTSQCLCGQIVTARCGDLRTGNTASCGCFKRELLTTLTHGLSRTPEYKVWAGMKQRCLNPSNSDYNLYGGRGITVCRRWLRFESFFEDNGRRPVGGMLDRVDNEGNYSCGQCEHCRENNWDRNVKWSSPTQQARNKRNNRPVTINGVTRLICEWAEIRGINADRIKWRIYNGWSETDAIMTPLGQRRAGL